MMPISTSCITSEDPAVTHKRRVMPVLGIVFVTTAIFSITCAIVLKDKPQNYQGSETIF